ncbi:DUF4365 domain-containing protein [Streptoalloteichus hindustanus]|uniref:DUF4365 domain-containing protein n=1 Tax=Streptoalloteichus hindustanus TaxID=2017 RepID=A0A1M5LFB0_STRHI|nr:DUF4365 domain-containing protein [Streptoalloteichus hindustanus]SHG63645.1 protein of unknown function [Streptoalloteichus hindustanus]
MTLDRRQHQGLFGEVFVRALAVAAGLTVAKTDPDVTGDDFLFGYPGQLAGTYFPRIEVQVKSWSRPNNGSPFWRYPMKVEHYNNLVYRTLIPRFLILVIVPENADQYVIGTHGHLRLQHAAYWASFTGRPEIDPRRRSTVTAEVPRTNLLTAGKLVELFEDSPPGEVLF